MDFLSKNIKLRKEDIANNILKNKKNILLTYLFFSSTCQYFVYNTIDNICEELKLKTNCHNKNNNQSIIKQTIQELIDDNVLSTTDNILNMPNNKLFKLNFVNYNNFVSVNEKYVSISIDEYNALLNCNGDTFRNFNLYCKIKSYVCMDSNCLHICYPSISKLHRDLSCSKNSFAKTLQNLMDNRLIYVYRFPDLKLKTIKSKSIEYIFSLEQYTKQQIKQNFLFKS